MWNDLGEYITNLCDNSLNKKEKVVEVGVGKFLNLSNYLKYKNIDILMTDISPSNKDIIQDDISNPDIQLYKNAKVIYSIRPPSEIQPYLRKIADKIDNSILIIKPLFNEDLNTGRKMRLVNYKKAVFYEYIPNK